MKKALSYTFTHACAAVIGASAVIILALRDQPKPEDLSQRIRDGLESMTPEERQDALERASRRLKKDTGIDLIVTKQ